ncbi:MAG TPA: DUF58 domain-containing protein [Candidatus Dormibacteraeota bacterium]|nr:DUF58 domain-containing protein [Candidatus Dormibacteraeota bacterium]
MTRRGLLVLLGACVVVALGAVSAVVLWLGVALLGCAVAAVVVDNRRAPGASRLQAVRSHDPVLSVGRANLVRVRVDVSGAAPPGDALLRDEHPPDVPASAEVLRLRLPGEASYMLSPHTRAVTRFGRVVVRAPGPWRLAMRQTAFPETASDLHIDPDVSALRAYDALARRGALLEIGVRDVRRPGEGTEFERVREHVPDDPMRQVNWRATARTGRLMTSELIPERAQPVIICLDHGRLMGVGAGALTKLDHAVNAALLLANAALRHGDRVGMLSFDDRITALLRPRAGRSQIRALLDAVQPLRPGDTEADYDTALGHLDSWQRRRSLLAIFTDVIDPDQGAALIRQCARLRRRHLPLVITVRDPAIDDAARRSPVDARTTYARAVASGLLSAREDTLLILRRSGIETLDADARTLSPRLVNRYLELKRRAAV